MNKKWIIGMVFVFSILMLLIGICVSKELRAYKYAPDKTVKIIFDTDMDTDVDDAGALAILHSYIREGKAELLAAVGSCNTGYTAPCIDAINTYYGLPDVPIGISPDCPDKGVSRYQKYIAENFENDILSDRNAESAVNVYRKCLADADNDSVVIVVVGPLNNLYDLLLSQGDSYSSLNGINLVKKKVKLCVIMGGQFPKSKPQGEYNISLAPEAAAYVSQNFPGHIMWCGYEIGETVMTGGRIGELSGNNPVRVAYEQYSNNQEGFTRSSWDLIAVMYAVEGRNRYFSEMKGKALLGSDITVSSDQETRAGYNQWKIDRFSKDAIMVSLGHDERVAELLDQKMVESEQK